MHKNESTQRDSLELRIISHACAITKCNEKKLIFDPWLSGKVFNNGWELKNEIDIKTISEQKINYVYISHEHPDHFHVPTLKALNDSWNPTFLIQKTNDRRVSTFIRKVLGKEVIELADGKELRLSKQMSIRIYSHGHMDSFALVKLGRCNILNINDCVLKSKESLNHLRSRLPAGMQIDILMSQYSFASYQGNRNEGKQIYKASAQHLEWIKQRENFFKPLMFIPFASGINWCSTENSYLNEYSVKYKDALKAITQSLTPNDQSQINVKDVLVSRGQQEDHSRLSRQTNETAKANSSTLNINAKEELLNVSKKLKEARKTLNKQNAYLAIPAMHLAGILGLLNPIRINLEEKNGETINLLLYPGLRLKKEHKRPPKDDRIQSEITMSLDSLKYSIENQFGAETLWVNSRFQIDKGSPKDFFKHFYPSIMSNQGFNFPIGYLRFVWERIIMPKASSFKYKLLSKS